MTANRNGDEFMDAPVNGTIRVLCGGTWGLFQSHYFLVRNRFVRKPVLMPNNGGIGFRVRLAGRVPK